MIISFFSSLCTPSEYLKVIVKTTTTLTAEQIASFETQLKHSKAYRASWLKYQRVSDQIDSQIVIMYQKGSDKRFLRKFESADELTQEAIDQILTSVRTFSSPAGCH